MKLLINTKEKGAPLGDMFGIFFEDLNHAADGGLYAELIRNRSFEFDEIDNRNYHSLTAWEPIGDEDGLDITVSTDKPLNENNIHYLVLNRKSLDKEAGIMNLGYNTGIPLSAGEQYRLCFFGGTEEGVMPVSISLRSLDGEIYDSAEFKVEGPWTKYEHTFEVSKTDYSARLVIIPQGLGTVNLDMISLFPVNTYLGRENGLRKDIAQVLADMKPKFMRFPGGCLTHDGRLEKDAKDQMYDWKNTVRKVEERPSRRNNWGYNQTLGLGFYEYFLFCKDIGAKPIPVISAGWDPHHKRAVPMEELGAWVQDALDLIEFANGDVTTPYGKLRAEMGHPEPFGMEYLGIGNEEVDDEFFERYEVFHKAIREMHPEIKLIGTSGPFPAGVPYDKGWDNAKKNGADLVDEHYYTSPEWLIKEHYRYDNFDPNGPKVFVGEYASKGNTYFNAIAEASFMIGLEKSAATVGLACYAPLLCNVDYRNWEPDLIYFNNHKVAPSANYYVQKLFMHHQGEHILELKKEGIEPEPVEFEPINGEILLHNYRSDVSYYDISITNEDTGEVFNYPDVRCFEEETDKLLTTIDFTNWTLRMKAKENKDGYGFRIDFGRKSSKDFYEWLIGGWANEDDMISEVINGRGSVLYQRQLFRTNKEYDLCLKVRGRNIESFIDGELSNRAVSHQYAPEPLYASASIDDNGDIIIKAANVTDKPAKVDLCLDGVSGSLKGKAYLLSDYPLDAENTIDNPDYIRPKEIDVEFDGNEFTYEFPKYSFTVLRLR